MLRFQIPERVMSFSEQKRNTIEAGVELYKHYLNSLDPIKYSMFSESAKGDTYEVKNAKFNDLFVLQSVKNAYLPETAVNDKGLFRKSNVREEAFALIGEVLDVIIPQTLKNSFFGLSDMKIVGRGNTAKYKIPNNKLLHVNKVAKGIRKSEPQSLFNGDGVLNPEPKMITIDEDFENILTGKVDWGLMIMKVALSFQDALATEIYESILAQYTSGLPANLKEAGYSQVAFTKLAARVGGLNQGAKVICMGTKVALGNILPTNDYLKMSLGDEYNAYGYVREFMGVDIMEIPQTIAVNTDDFGISDDYVYFFSLATDKPVKIAMEDSGMSFENTNPSNSADTSVWYSLEKAWDLAVLTSSAFGIMKVT